MILSGQLLVQACGQRSVLLSHQKDLSPVLQEHFPESLSQVISQNLFAVLSQPPFS